jgi:HEAT repeat protein
MAAVQWQAVKSGMRQPPPEDAMPESDASDVHQFHALIASLGSEDGVERCAARRALILVGSPAVGPLLHTLSDPRKQVRWEVVKALGAIGDPAAAPELVAALDDDAPRVRWVAAEALVSIGPDCLRALLRGLISGASSPMLREAAHHAIRGLIAHEQEVEILERVQRSLEASSPGTGVPAAAEVALAALDLASQARAQRPASG